MKIASGIIGIMLGLLVLLQACTVATTANWGGNESVFEAGSVGVLVGFLIFVGGAFAFGLPIVSMVVFAIAAVFAFAVSATFPDMGIWGGAAVILAVFAFIGRRSDQRANAKAPTAS